MGVFIVEVWVVELKVLLPHLIHQAGVLAKHL